MPILRVIILLTWSLPVFAQSFTYEDLVSLIQQKNLKQLEEVLPLLPTNFRSHYTLMYQSRSLQGASEQNPRVLMYGPNAKLTCTFNGEPNQKGFDTLECFQFREDSGTFDFRQIQFPTKTNGLSDVLFSESNHSADKKVSCTGCHFADPRPNWDHYDSWPGAYGSSDDVLEATEETNYKNYVAQRASHPRYRWLIQGSKPLEPYMDFNNGEYDIEHRPNLYFSEAVGRLTGVRDQRLMQTKLGELPTLMFAMRVLNCNFTDAQKAAFKNAGKDVDADLDLGKIFQRLQIDPKDWSTQVFNDVPSFPLEPWDHQFGYSFLKENLAMKVVQDLAKNDSMLASGIAAIKAYFNSAYTGVDLQFYQTMNETIVGLDMFGQGYNKNRDYLCPRMAEIFTEKYLQPAMLQ